MRYGLPSRVMDRGNSWSDFVSFGLVLGVGHVGEGNSAFCYPQESVSPLRVVLWQHIHDKETSALSLMVEPSTTAIRASDAVLT